MISMEFDEMKKIWDSQNNEPIYGINEKALQKRILTKQKQAHHTTNFSELLSILGNAAAGFLVLGMSIFKRSENIFMYLLPVWMFITASYCLVSRIRRTKGDRRFDRSMHADLDYAISVATYQVRFSHIMRWNILPIGILVVLGVWEGAKSVWLAVGVLTFMVVAHYASGWEHCIYKTRKRELATLRDQLEN